jgi:hypothetical protein
VQVPARPLTVVGVTDGVQLPVCVEVGGWRRAEQERGRSAEAKTARCCAVGVVRPGKQRGMRTGVAQVTAHPRTIQQWECSGSN